MFGKEKESKEDKQGKEMQKFTDKYQLEDLDEKDLIVLKRIAGGLVGTGLMRTGVMLSFGKAAEKVQIGYLGTMVDQNWMMIRQLGRLNRNIEKLLEK